MTVLQMYQLWSNIPLFLILYVCLAVDLCNSLYLLHKEASFIVCVHYGILFIHKEKWNNIIWCKWKDLEKYYMVWGKEDPEKKKNKTYSALFVDPSSQSWELDI